MRESCNVCCDKITVCTFKASGFPVQCKHIPVDITKNIAFVLSNDSSKINDAAEMLEF